MKSLRFFNSRSFLSLIFFIFTSWSAMAQDFEHLMIRRHLDCADVAFNSGIHFARLMEENKTDSAALLLEYWERRCGVQEPVFRARLLMALHKGTFDPSMLQKGTLAYIFNYRNRIDMIQNAQMFAYDRYSTYYGSVPPDMEFDAYTRSLAGRLMQQYDAQTTEFMLAEFFSGQTDSIFTRLEQTDYQAHPLAAEYHDAVRHYKSLSEFHFSVLSGVWIPTGGIRKLGLHPDVGFQVGMKYKKMNYDVTMSFKFLNSPNHYFARRTRTDQSVEMTNHFFGGYMGLDIGRDIYTHKGHEWQLMGGIALDGFDALKENKDLNQEAESTLTYNFNLGLGYRYYYTHSIYVGIRAKYNMVDYALNNVVDFTGNPFTIQLIIGGVDSATRNYYLRQLGQRMRR
jgi:hypothetical protein